MTKDVDIVLTPDAAAIARDLKVDPAFDPAVEIERRIQFLDDALLTSGQSVLVLGISGGIDSATAGRLCQLTAERVREAGRRANFIAMRLPYASQTDEHDARAALEFIRPDQLISVDMQPASDALLASVIAGGLSFRDASQEDFILGNIKARQRMIAQYAVAGALGGLVVGTDHAAEAVTGFFTKFGDGAFDIAPLAGLTKRRVRAVAEVLGAPRALVDKTPTADLETLVPGRPDEHAFGFTYDEIDDFLEGKTVSEEVAQAITARYHATEHKRELPRTP